MEFVLKNEYTADNEERYIVWVNGKYFKCFIRTHHIIFL